MEQAESRRSRRALSAAEVLAEATPEVEAPRSPAASDLGNQRRGKSRHDSQRAPRGVFSWVVQIFGELLITLGLVLMLFVGWELWWTNVQADQTQAQAVQNFAKELNAPTEPQGDPNVDYGPAPVTADPGPTNTVFGLAFIPRFGANYAPRPLVQGTAQKQLDTLGLGHYPSTSMPGAKGNFAVAGHRQTHGAVLDNLDSLMPGDRIYIQTKQGYYTYVYRNSEIVTPNQTNVLDAVPMQPTAAPEQSLLTMTSCNPRFGTQERLIAYSVLESWRPLSAGPPPEIAAQVKALAEKR